MYANDCTINTSDFIQIAEGISSTLLRNFTSDQVVNLCDLQTSLIQERTSLILEVSTSDLQDLSPQQQNKIQGSSPFQKSFDSRAQSKSCNNSNFIDITEDFRIATQNLIQQEQSREIQIDKVIELMGQQKKNYQEITKLFVKYRVDGFIHSKQFMANESGKFDAIINLTPMPKSLTFEQFLSCFKKLPYLDFLLNSQTNTSAWACVLSPKQKAQACVEVYQTNTKTAEIHFLQSIEKDFTDIEGIQQQNIKEKYAEVQENIWIIKLSSLYQSSSVFEIKNRISKAFALLKDLNILQASDQFLGVDNFLIVSGQKELSDMSILQEQADLYDINKNMFVMQMRGNELNQQFDIFDGDSFALFHHPSGDKEWLSCEVLLVDKKKYQIKWKHNSQTAFKRKKEILFSHPPLSQETVLKKFKKETLSLKNSN